MPSSVDNHSLCGNLLACHGEAGETEQLTTGHQVTTQCDLGVV